VDRLRNRVVPHRVIRLGGKPASVIAVPSLGGRLLEWRAHDRQWLQAPDPANEWQAYPANGGYAEFAIYGLYTQRGWSEKYRAQRRGDALRMAAGLTGGLELQRTVTMRDGELTIESALTNTGNTTVSAGWGASLQLHLPDWQVIAFDTASGPARLASGDVRSGLEHAVVLEGERRPNGAWRITVPGLEIASRYSNAPVSRFIVGQVAAQHLVAIDLRTPVQSLAPGASIRVRQQLTVCTAQ
jgi:hypothetical protein